MVITASSEMLENIDFDPADEADEITQNVAALMVTPRGSVPLERGMGLPMNYKDKIPAVAQIMFEAELAAVVDEYEPRASLVGAESEVDEDGNISMTAEVTLNGG